MATRPARKRSSFGATHPIEHLEDKPSPERATTTEPISGAEESESHSSFSSSSRPQASTELRKPGPAPSGKVKKKAALWADEDIIERIRGAWFHTPTTSGEREMSFSDFLLEAALARATERERKYNHGEEFPSVPAGRIGVGRKS